MKFEHDDYFYLLIYVDDMLLVSKNKSVLNDLKHMLNFESEMKDFGLIKTILGMDIVRDRSKGCLFLS